MAKLIKGTLPKVPTLAITLVIEKPFLKVVWHTIFVIIFIKTTQLLKFIV